MTETKTVDATEPVVDATEKFETIEKRFKELELKGNAKKQMAAICRASDSLVLALKASGDVPTRALTLHRRLVNRPYVILIKARKKAEGPAKALKIAEQIAKLQAQLAGMDPVEETETE